VGDATEVDVQVVDVVDGHPADGMLLKSRLAGALSTEGSTNSKVSRLENIMSIYEEKLTSNSGVYKPVSGFASVG